MDQNGIRQQAQKIDALLFALLRRLSVNGDDAVAELPLAQLRLCGLLHYGPRPMSALSRDLGVSLSALTQIADRLERANLVKRVAEENDRRVRCLRLTPRGESVMQQRRDAHVDHATAAMARLPSKKRKEVLAALETLVGACSAGKDEELPSSLAKAIV